MNTDPKDAIRALHDRIINDAADDNQIIAAGWYALRKMAIPETASAIQLSEMRKAFYAGAQHLYASIMNMLDPGAEPTERDVERMAGIHDELNRFVEKLKLEGISTKEKRHDLDTRLLRRLDCRSGFVFGFVEPYRLV